MEQKPCALLRLGGRQEALESDDECDETGSLVCPNHASQAAAQQGHRCSRYVLATAVEALCLCPFPASIHHHNLKAARPRSPSPNQSAFLASLCSCRIVPSHHSPTHLHRPHHTHQRHTHRHVIKRACGPDWSSSRHGAASSMPSPPLPRPRCR